MQIHDPKVLYTLGTENHTGQYELKEFLQLVPPTPTAGPRGAEPAKGEGLAPAAPVAGETTG